MAISEMEPNEQVKRLYDQLGELVEESDDALIDQGPGLLQDALEDPGFLAGIETKPATDSYTRAKVMGEPEKHVIRYMEWPPEYTLLPHEHHGRPCFEVLVEGLLFVANMDVTEVKSDVYELEVIESYECSPGEAAVIDPRTGCDVHAVYTPVRSKSLHVYPNDAYHSIGYVPVETEDPQLDHYERRKFRLRDGAS